MPWITNVPMEAVRSGSHPKSVISPTVLIQIVDPDMDFPEPHWPFADIFRFKFLDIEDGNPNAETHGIQDSQAEEIFRILQTALADDVNVLVHCVAGICRSGAVVEVGSMMGFDEIEGVYRCPNLRVKRMLMQLLGWTYDHADAVEANLSRLKIEYGESIAEAAGEQGG